MTQSYPLLVQYTVENLTEKPRSFKAEFVSDKFFVEYLDVTPSVPRANRRIR